MIGWNKILLKNALLLRFMNKLDDAESLQHPHLKLLLVIEHDILFNSNMTLGQGSSFSIYFYYLCRISR